MKLPWYKCWNIILLIIISKHTIIRAKCGLVSFVQESTTHSAKTRPYHVPSTSLHDVLFHSSTVTGPVWKFAGRNFSDVASPSISDIQRTCAKNVCKDNWYDVLYWSVKGRLKDGPLSDVIFIARTFYLNIKIVLYINIIYILFREKW